MSHVVIFDPQGIEPEGEVLNGQAAEVAKARGVAMLPIVTPLLRRNAFAGWAKRAYGRGWKFDPTKSSRGCPLSLHADPQFPIITWTARIVRDDAMGDVSGTLRFAADTAQSNSLATGINNETPPVSIPALGAPDELNGWTIGGRARVSIPGDSFIAFQLFGQLSGARVEWFAASQTAQ